MVTNHPLDHFYGLQAVVLSLLDRARPHLDARDADAWATLAPFREGLEAALHALQVHKHREVFDPMITLGGTRAATVVELKVECIKLGLDYQAYTQTWESADIGARWPEYRLAALSMMRQMRERLALQDQAIRRLYERSGPYVEAADRTNADI